MNFEIREPATAEEFEACYDLRWRILRGPWGQPRGSERDEREDASVHLMARAPGHHPAAVGRLHWNSPEEAQIRYMAVEDTLRRTGLGSLILRELEARARESGVRRIVLDARETARDFYERHGYAVRTEGHTLFGSVRHFRMSKELPPG